MNYNSFIRIFHANTHTRARRVHIRIGRIDAFDFSDEKSISTYRPKNTERKRKIYYKIKTYGYFRLLARCGVCVCAIAVVQKYLSRSRRPKKKNKVICPSNTTPQITRIRRGEQAARQKKTHTESRENYFTHTAQQSAQAAPRTHGMA